jgi:hypothetical protein
LYAQEPQFTPLDISFLSTLSVTVLSTGVERHITTSSFVFAPFVDWPLLLRDFLQGKDPQLYIGNEVLSDYTLVASSADKQSALSICNEEGKKFLESRAERRVAAFELHGSALDGLTMYCQRDLDT